MATLDQVSADSGPVHLLLIASTKMGKSTYVAEAAISGFNVAYFDSDNGLSALRYRLSLLPPDEMLAAQKRVNYLPTDNPHLLWKGVLQSTALRPFFWVPDANRIWNPKLNLEPDITVWRFDVTAAPANMIFAYDSWTSISNDALKMFRPGQSAPLLDGVDQSIYGEAKAVCGYVCNMLQSLPNHVIVLAHATRYEIYEKPKNMKAQDIKQKDMTLMETWEVPVSSSRIAGYEMGSRFNHIGWLDLNGLGAPTIDFTRKAYRVGGGPPNKVAKTTDLPFAKLVSDSNGPMPTPDIPVGDWHIELPHSEMVKLLESQKKA